MNAAHLQRLVYPTTMCSPDAKKFPYEFKSLHPKESAKLKENYEVSFEFVRVGPKGYILSADYKHDAENIYNIPIRADDVIVYSFPRSGTTWTQELVWLIIKDLDYEAARSIPLTRRYTFLELSSLLYWNDTDKFNKHATEGNVEFLKDLSKCGSEILASCQSPRFVKTHLSLSLLPLTTLDTAKVLYVARDPRDVAVSFYHHNKLFKHLNYKGDFKTYWELFRNGLVLWSPYFEHLKEAWALRHHPNMLFLFYEELSKDLPAMVHRVATFLDKQLSEVQVADLCEYLSFEKFKKNDSVNFKDFQEYGIMNEAETFIRKGKTGGWRDYFDEEMAQDADRWIAHNLRNTDLRFPHLNY